MMNGRKSIRFGVGILALALLVAAQPPAPTPPSTAPSFVPGMPPPVEAPLANPPLAQPPAPPPLAVVPPAPRFNFKIDPKTPAKNLLPVAPKVAPNGGPVLTDDLRKIPEVEFQAKPEKVPEGLKTTEQAAHQIAKINHLNAKKTDAFMSALLENRPDLGGLPFVMGDDCRVDGERAKHFTQAANTVRQALAGNTTRVSNLPTPPPAPPAPQPILQQGAVMPVGVLTALQTTDVIQEVLTLQARPFWQQYAALCEQEDAARVRPDKETTEHVTLARVAALTQMLAPESAELRLGLVKYLTGVPHVESSKALARMVLFSPEEDIRTAAVTALKVRREKDYTDVLVKGLRYPWPAVARRAADGIAKLERADLIPELLAVLEATDPRLPTTKETGGKKVTVALEMVKVNHHRNCLMCHAPSGSGTPNPEALQAEVAIQGQPLPSPSEGYRQSTQELMIRLDVTYLRQDFSARLPVKDAHPWPEMQRFDFFVRARTLTDDEAATYRDKLTPKEAGVLSPYHRAALAALRELTGKDAAPTAEAWRKLLGSAPKPVVPRG